MERWSPAPLDAPRLERRIRELSRPLAPIPTGHPPRLVLLPDVAAILFDVYGTLVVSGCGELGVASSQGRPAAFEEACADATIPGARGLGARAVALLEEAVRAEHAHRHAAGVSAPEVEIRSVWRQVLDGLGLRAGDDAVERLSLEYELRVNPVWPMPGARDVLTVLSRRGFPMGLVSNAQFYTPLLFPTLFDASPDHLGLTEDLCAWSCRLGQAKPSAEVFLGPLDVLRRRHGLNPHQVLYVGNDRRNDVATAARAGCRTALFAGDARSLRLRPGDPSCEGSEPDVVLTALDQLPGLLPATPQPR